MILAIQSVTYKNDHKTILKNVSLSLEAGKHLLIHGASGCGKSTLMHIMAGLLRPMSGSIEFKGQNYATMTDAQLDQLRGQQFGFIFQKMHLIGHLTARQNISLVGSNSLDQDMIKDLDIEHILDQKASSLSVGEAQRVALVRALANNPAIIFADEPTSALDDVNADKVVKTLRVQAEKYGASLIITSHDRRIQSQFDHQLEL